MRTVARIFLGLLLAPAILPPTAFQALGEPVVLAWAGATFALAWWLAAAREL
jgi:hypothetical protein